MSVNIKIKVTKDILERSKHCQPGMDAGKNCAISLAIREILPNAFVDDYCIIPFGKRLKDVYDVIETTHYKNKIVLLPEIAQKFIEKFDNMEDEERAKLSEVEFDLNLPNWVVRRIGNGEIEEVKRIISQSKTLELC